MPRPLNYQSGRYDIRANPEQLKAWAECAARDGLNLATWIRRALDAEVRRERKRKP